MPKIDAWKSPVSRELFFEHSKYIDTIRSETYGEYVRRLHKRTDHQMEILKDSIFGLSSVQDVLNSLIINQQLLVKHGMWEGSNFDIDVYPYRDLIISASPLDEGRFEYDDYYKRRRFIQEFQFSLHSTKKEYAEAYLHQFRFGIEYFGFHFESVEAFRDNNQSMIKLDIKNYPVLRSLYVLLVEEGINE